MSWDVAAWGLSSSLKTGSWDAWKCSRLSVAISSNARASSSVFAGRFRRPLVFTTREEALSLLRPGVDGVILIVGGRRATFLPQVWDDLPDPELFISYLMHKAGLPPSYWGDDVRLERYGVEAFEE